jgi:hypothetical protein
MLISGRAAKVEKARKQTAIPTGTSPSKARKTMVVGCARSVSMRVARTFAASGAPPPIGSRE